MDTWDAIRSRKNIRTFRDEPIPANDLDRILEAGRRSPSSGNRQRWDFVVVTDSGDLERLAQVWQGASHIAGATTALALVAPATDDPDLWGSIQYDLGQVTMSMMIMAADLGVGTAHAKVDDHEMAGEILGLPDDRQAVWLIGMGLPQPPLTPIKRPDRKEFEAVVHRDNW
ncbi:MAG: nitroreductase [Acidimicrobiia bacterium]|nr:nitroreductase [Acidimicrobiia bacterium]